jgi:outer membrane lipoprotein-sorting protein
MRMIVRLTLSLCAALALATLARADAEADVKALLEKAIRASGGEEKLVKVKAMRMKSKGKFYGLNENGIDYTAETAWQYPDRVRDEIHAEDNGQKVVILQIVDGNKGWTSIGGATEEMSKDALEEATENVYANRVSMLYPLKDKEFKLTPLADAKVGDKEAIGIKVSSKGHRDISLYFDKKTALLIKSESKVKDMNEAKEVSQETYFDDYKDVDGIQTPFKVTIKRADKNYVTAEMSEVKIVDKLDDKLFEKP